MTWRAVGLEPEGHGRGLEGGIDGTDGNVGEIYPITRFPDD